MQRVTNMVDQTWEHSLLLLDLFTLGSYQFYPRVLHPCKVSMTPNVSIVQAIVRGANSLIRAEEYKKEGLFFALGSIPYSHGHYFHIDLSTIHPNNQSGDKVFRTLPIVSLSLCLAFSSL